MYLTVLLVCWMAFVVGTSVTAGDWPTLLGWYAVTQYSVLLIYHRYLSHQAFATSSRGVHFILVLYGASCAQGNPISWATSHREHHKHCDTEKDPHSIHHHSWDQCTVIWAMRNLRYDQQRMSFSPLQSPEAWFVMQSWWVVCAGRLLLTWLLSGGDLYLVWIHFVAPISLSTCSTLFTNVMSHWSPLGNSRICKAVNSWTINAVQIGAGEGWHQDHHHNSRFARAGERWYQVDVVFRLICLLEWFGAVHSVVRGRHPTSDHSTCERSST